MNRQHILEEIVRTAAQNGGVALGKQRFCRQTGIKETDWSGKFWARWGDAVSEAGCIPNKLQERFDLQSVLESYASLVRELGRIPVDAELKLKRTQSPGFPSHNTFWKLGNKAERIEKLIKYCESTSDCEDILAIVRACRPKEIEEPLETDPSDAQIGFVYLLKANRHYKIGRCNSFERRSRELAIQLPERAETVHVIRTDDPVGIEAYWHRRFEAKRKNGEWFELNAADVKAFKRRKFM